MRDEGVIYVTGHPLLNRRCTRLPRWLPFSKARTQLQLQRHDIALLCWKRR